MSHESNRLSTSKDYRHMMTKTHLDFCCQLYHAMTKELTSFHHKFVITYVYGTNFIRDNSYQDQQIMCPLLNEVKDRLPFIN